MANLINVPLLSDDFLASILRQIQDTHPPITVPVAPPTSVVPINISKPPTRCPVCRHKLQLADMPCRCGMRHCSAHRLPELHGCTIDYKTYHRTLLESQVIRCVADKMKEGRL